MSLRLWNELYLLVGYVFINIDYYLTYSNMNPRKIKAT